MTQKQIPIPQVTTRNPLQVRTPIASERSLRPRVPISYNETLLQRLHGRPQVKILNNLSIPLPESSDKDTEGKVEATAEEKREDRDTASK